MEHLERLNQLATECDSIGVTLYEYNYSYQSFGCWSITIGKPHQRMRFYWDGRESYFGIEESGFTNSSSSACWVDAVANNSISPTKPVEIFKLISEKVREKYCT